MNEKLDYFKLANTEEFVERVVSNAKYKFRKYIYGVLVPDVNHPLSCVSASNDTLSIDMWTGCQWQCRYCHVQGTAFDIEPRGKMFAKPKRRSRFSIQETVDSIWFFRSNFWATHYFISRNGYAFV